MSDLEPLLTEIAGLLDLAEDHDDPDRLERTLTDGYAQALTLEAERTTLERQVLRLSLTLDEEDGSSADEVSALARRLDACDHSFEQLRGELVRLRHRHSRAVRAQSDDWIYQPGWACEPNPDSST